ncbi:TetR-like C-terminal domain-containing protein [Pectinatus frisingensis]|uniref:TetR-like C-terminal domain-containing protein n=1 Tax=Pectinatus frisingensis TaxID=865 RepID=UPI0039BFCD26
MVYVTKPSLCFRSALHGFISLEKVGFFQGTKANVDKSYKQLVTRFLPTLTIREES